jgi:hypothetical protein
MWPIATCVNKPENDDPSIVGLIELATGAAQTAFRPFVLCRIPSPFQATPLDQTGPRSKQRYNLHTYQDGCLGGAIR